MRAGLTPRTLTLYLADRMLDEGNNVVPIDGQPGTGKSTTALYLAWRLADVLGEEFDPETNTYVSREQYLAAIQGQLNGERRDGEIHHLDEGANVAYSREHSSRSNRRVKQIQQQVRVLGNTEFWCTPDFFMLDAELRENYVNARVLMIRKRVALIMRRARNPFTGEERWEQGKPWRVPDVPTLLPGVWAKYYAKAKGAKRRRMQEILDQEFTERPPAKRLRLREPTPIPPTPPTGEG